MSPEGAAAAAAAAVVLGGFIVPVAPAAPLAPLAPALAPAVGAAVAAGAAVGAAAYLWDWVRRNGFPGGQFAPEYGPDAPARGTRSPTGATRWRCHVAGRKHDAYGSSVVTTSHSGWIQLPSNQRLTMGPLSSVVELPGGVRCYGGDVWLYVVGTGSGTGWVDAARTPGFAVGSAIFIEAESLAPDGEPIPAPPVRRPDWPAEEPDGPEPQPGAPFWEPVPVPVPLQPSPVPSPGRVPGADPQVLPRRDPGIPLPLAPPIPAAPPVVVPFPLREPGPEEEEEPDPESLEEADVEPTPVWLEIPWPGAAPIGQPAQRPAPGDAAQREMLGRLEEKLAQIGGRGAGEGIDWEDVADLVRDALSGGRNSYPAGEYVLRRVCEVDAGGVALPPLAARWSAGQGALAELSAKLDALAELLQHHKTIKQPICPADRAARPVGRPVTVTFEQV